MRFNPNRHLRQAITICLLLFSICCRSQSPTLEWVQQFGDTPNENTRGSYIIIDSNRAIVTAGTFVKSVDFDKSAGVASLTSAGEEDIFIAKHDTAGNFIWAKRIGGIWADGIRDIKFDLQGNLMVLGMFQGTVDLDPGPGVQEYTSSFTNNFLLKLDNNGNFIWVKTFLLNDANCIEIDRQGNILIGGGFGGTQDFDPGPGVFNMTADLIYNDLFVLKLDGDANFIWAKQMVNQGAAESQEFGIETDAQNNVYFAGGFTNAIDFDPGASSFIMSSAGLDDIYVLKLDAAGNFQWSKRWGAAGTDKAFALEVDDAGNVYTTGHYYFTVDFDPGPGIVNHTSTFNGAFISKLDASGNLVFAKTLSGGKSIGHDIKLDSSLNIYLSGHFSETVDFDPGPGIHNLTGGHMFTLKLDNNGNFRWAADYVNTTNVFYQSIYNSIAIDIYKNVYQAGSFPTTVDFDPGPGSTELTPVGFWDMYMFKLRQCYTATHLSAGFCTGYTLNGQTYTTSGTHYQVFPLSPDCDSVVSLTLRKLDKLSELQATACNSYLWNGNVYTASGVFRDSFPLPSGCDSIVQLTLTINTSPFSSLQHTACGSYLWNGQTYMQSGLYRDTFAIAGGCDSIAELQLLIKPLPQPMLGADTTICLGKSLVLDPGNFDQYLWIGGSTGNSLTATNSALYWVQVQTGDCVATDSIAINFVACNECEITADTKVYPTPFRSMLTIDKNWTSCAVYMDLYNALGQLVMKDRLLMHGVNQFYLDHLAAGMYFYVLKGRGKQIGSGQVLKQ